MEGEEDSGTRALVDGHFGDVFSVEGDSSCGGDVGFVSCDDFGECGFAGAVWSHDGVDFAGWNLKVYAIEDFGSVFECCVEVLYFQGHGRENGRWEIGRLGDWGSVCGLKSALRLGHLAAEGDFDVFDDGVRGEIEKIGEVDAGFEFYVVDGASGFVVEMAVFVKVWAVAGRFTVEVDLADNFVLNEGFKAVIYCRERDVRKGFSDAHEYFVGGGVDALPHQKAVDFLALAGHSEAVDFLWDVLYRGF